MNEKEKLLLNESYLTYSMLGNGLNALRKATIFNKGLYYQAFFSLSIGIERLLKIIIITKYRSENNEKFPTEEDINIKSFGHDLIKLMKYLNIEIEDKINLDILNLLNDFSKKSRYFNIDGIINENINYKNPLYEWNQISKEIIKTIKNKKTINNKELLANILDENTSIFMYNLEGTEINDSLLLLNELGNIDLPKYATERVFYIIRNIIFKLKEIERNKYMIPYLTEVFYIYLGDYTRSEIRNKKNWLNLT